MKLKVKFLKWSAGLPVVMLNEETAKKLGLHSKDRVSIKKLSKPKKTSCIIDIIEDIIDEDEIVISSELKKILELKEGENVEVNLASSPRSLTLLKNKLDGKRLSEKDIFTIIGDIVENKLSEAEISLFISGMYIHGMNFKETISLIKAISGSGDHLKFPRKIVVDKHSIGGVAGNRTTPIVVSICATTGLVFPKTSSRAITSAAGTVDVMETITKVDFSKKEVKEIVNKTGACMVWGGSLGMVPADSKIITIEKMLHIDPEAQLLASIISKKISVGSKHILIDIPYGRNAKVGRRKAKRLKRKFEKIGRYFNKNIKCVLTKGDEPIGKGIGPSLEIIDVIDILDPEKQGPKDLEEKSLYLAGEILEMTKKAEKGKGNEMAREILQSGKAFSKFKEIIHTQKGKIIKIPKAKFKKDIISNKKGIILDIDNKQINFLARISGCPIDKLSGVFLYFNERDKVKKGDKLITIYSESESRLEHAVKYYKDNKIITVK